MTSMFQTSRKKSESEVTKLQKERARIQSEQRKMMAAFAGDFDCSPKDESKTKKGKNGAISPKPAKVTP